jgi:hypothetical protein
MIILYDIGNIADWLSALGTISAVIVALYLARRDRKPNAQVTSSVSYEVSLLGASNEPVNINFNIVNVGSIPIHLIECSIQVSKRSKDRMIFLDGSHNVDKLLSPGEHYEHSLPYDDFKKYYIKNNIKKITTFGYFKDATGKKYKTKVIRSFK